MTDDFLRCRWAKVDAQLRAYHDIEWGTPKYESRALLEKLILDGFQAGLSWRTILAKRAAFRAAFDGFDPACVASYEEKDIHRLLDDSGIVRSRRKIVSAIGNARAYLRMSASGEDLATFVWREVEYRPLLGDGTGTATRSAIGDRLSTALKQRGFSFVGPVIVHAWLQATGVINDHEAGCFRR